jgi:predicted MPP superfamily phosphohydrolase
MLCGMHAFVISCAVGAPLTVLAAAMRSRFFAIFTAIVVGLQSLIAATVVPELPVPPALVIGLQALVYLYFLRLARPRMGTALWRWGVALPAQVWAGGALLAAPWAVAQGFGARWGAPWAPFAAALFGALEALVVVRTTVDVSLDGEDVPEERRHRRGRGRVERPLRIVQITDPHLGPFMSERRLRRICERAVARDPDLVLLTGDFLTMASSHEPDVGGRTVLGRALEPLRALRGRTFACFGNHDHEAPDAVMRGLADAGVRLLVDEATVVSTPAGPVQIIGADFHWRGTAKALAALHEAHPRVSGALRLWLLHNPGHFRHLPPDAADLVLSGHTHGGQLGLVTFGLPFTLAGVFGRLPDHGLWARGRSRLYVHRGTGHYGFPIRFGVPAEESLLRVHAASRDLRRS